MLHGTGRTKAVGPNRAKVAIVTGASGGLGAAIAERLARDGHRVILTYGSDERAVALAARLPGATAHRLPLHDLEAVQQFGGQMAAEHDTVHALVCCAGRLDRNGLQDVTADELMTSFAINCAAPVLLARALLAPLRTARGSIVNVTSVTAQVAGRNRVSYTASKAALVGVTRALALELAPDVRVNALLPGLFDTQMNVPLKADPQLEDATLSRIPMRRLGGPEEFAGTVAWLISEDAAYVTGVAFAVDGGLLMRTPLPAGD
jgi:NAD(P)-dependent dehydrogenase (short-subunit alcohol dehydrogenase family)